MSISRQNLTIVIVTFKSEEVIHDCISSIGDGIKIIVVENSNNPEFKNKIEEEIYRARKRSLKDRGTY